MIEFLNQYYLWIKVVHIIAVICWMAGLLYLPRLFVYHKGVNNGDTYELFLTMERRLYSYIMRPSMIATLCSGIALMACLDWRHEPSLHAKILLVLLLIFYHHWLWYEYKLFIAKSNTNSARFFRVINEVPTIIMIFIIILVVVRPI